jgi:hypothetical protein
MTVQVKYFREHPVLLPYASEPGLLENSSQETSWPRVMTQSPLDMVTGKRAKVVMCFLRGYTRSVISVIISIRLCITQPTYVFTVIYEMFSYFLLKTVSFFNELESCFRDSS